MFPSEYKNASFMKWNKDNMGSTFMLEKKVESNPPFNPTQWAWWLVTVGVREMREVDGFYPHDQSYPPAVPNLPSHRLTPTVPSTYTAILSDTWLKFDHMSKVAALFADSYIRVS